MLKRILTVLGIAVATSVAALTGTAHASTPGCTNGVYSGYCGTQTSAAAPALSFDVFHRQAFYGNKVIGYPDSDSDPATDFFIFGYQGGSAKIFEYAPNGVASNLCVSEPSSLAGLVLRECNGSKWQQFTAAEVGSTNEFTWSNAQTGDIVTAGGYEAQLRGEAPPAGAALPTAAQQWAFSS